MFFLQYIVTSLPCLHCDMHCIEQTTQLNIGLYADNKSLFFSYAKMIFYDLQTSSVFNNDNKKTFLIITFPD